MFVKFQPLKDETIIDRNNLLWYIVTSRFLSVLRLRSGRVFIKEINTYTYIELFFSQVFIGNG